MCTSRSQATANWHQNFVKCTKYSISLYGIRFTFYPNLETYSHDKQASHLPVASLCRNLNISSRRWPT